MKIVVIDDEEDIASILTQLLTLHGHEVILCHDSLKAADLITISQPEVILCDLSMPNLNGIQVFQSVQKTWKGTFIILTGDTNPEIEEIYKIGINRVLFKPNDLTRIISVLDELTHTSR